MTAPITPDERAAMRERYTADLPSSWTAQGAWRRAILDRGQHAGADVPRLLDALDTAEAEAAEVREGACVWCDASRANCARWRSEQRACCPDCAHASHGPGRAATSPVWDEDTVTEAVARAIALAGDYDGCFERLDAWAAASDEARECGDVEEPLSTDAEDAEFWRSRARAAVAVVREHAPVRPDREAIADVLMSDWHGEYTCECQTDRCPSLPCPISTPSYVTAADAVLALWPGESRATVQAEALRDAADTIERYAQRTDVRLTEHAVAESGGPHVLREYADRLDPRGADRG